MRVTTTFGESSTDYTLKHAILIYESENSRNLAATTHKIKNYSGRPTITAGQPITISALEQLIQALGKNSGGSFLPANVLSLGIDRLLWWCPAGRRRIWFKPDNRFDDKLEPKTAAELKALTKLNGQFVHWPAMLFLAARGLSAFALPRNERPTAETKIYKAPCWNLHKGGMCAGNLKLPVVSPDNLAGFEQAFFDSSFTHNSGGGILTNHPQGHTGLWTELAARKTPPDATYWKRHLIPAKQNIATLIKNFRED